MSDFLEQKRDEIAGRMRELEPLLEEYRQLEAAASALAGVAPAPRRAGGRRAAKVSAAKPAARRTRTTRTGARTEETAVKRRGRPRGSGTRAREALELVGARPGITIPEMASAMGIKQNYLYRVLPTLEKEGKVVKRERGWHALPSAE